MKMAKAMALAVGFAMVLSAPFVYAGADWAEHKDGNGSGKSLEKMAQELNLTAEQKAALGKQREATRPKMEALKEKMRSLREALKAELDKAAPDSAKLGALVEDIKNATGERMQMKIDKVLEMKKILTPEQSAKMKSLMDAKKKEFEAKHKDKEGKSSHSSPHDDF